MSGGIYGSRVPDSVGGNSIKLGFSACPAETRASLGWKAKHRMTKASGKDLQTAHVRVSGCQSIQGIAGCVRTEP